MKKILFLFFFIPFVIKCQTAFIFGNDTICTNEGKANVTVSFIGTAPYTFTYSINGVDHMPISTNVNPYIIESNLSGYYTLTSFSDALSVGSTSGGAMVTIYTAPTAIISTLTDTIQSIFPFLQFSNSSLGDVNLLNWNFGDNTLSQIINNPGENFTIMHEFPTNLNESISLYQVSLIVTDVNNCMDTTYKNIFVMNDFWMHIPNSFTPDNDHINDNFCIEYNGIRELTFIFYVISKQGDIIFETTDPSSLKCSMNGGWDGKDIDGNFLMNGTYVYEIYFQDYEGWKYTKRGTINLIR